MRTPLGSEDLAALASHLVTNSHDDLTPFTRIGEGTFRVALLGPDDVVYKAPRSTKHHGEFADELATFNRIEEEGRTWCPDFWPYEQHGVMAMRRYEVALITPDPRRRDRGPARLRDDDAQWLTYWHEMQSAVRGPGGPHGGNFGWKPSGELVLIDGGG